MRSNWVKGMVWVAVVGFLGLLSLPAVVRGETPAEVEALRQEIVAKGLAYLAKSGQAADGTFTKQVGSGVTSLALAAALKNGRGVDDPMVAQGLKALEGFVHDDGGIYANDRLQNYETCVAMVCFKAANQDGRYNQLLKRATEFVTGRQYQEGEDRTSDESWVGGVGYGAQGRPDLSNTAYLIEALATVDESQNEQAIQAALAFVSRCQNLESPHNTTPYAALVKDGGFYYEIPTTKVDPSTSPERFTENGGLRSYGSMTYAGLKSMIFAGLTAEDQRVKAAVQWIKDHYGVDQNPGQGSAGLFYYYHTFAAALAAAELNEVVDADGKTHDWRADLIRELAKRQNPDGSWTNDNQRWFENDANLSTSFALLALSHCAPPAPAKKAP